MWEVIFHYNFIFKTHNQGIIYYFNLLCMYY